MSSFIIVLLKENTAERKMHNYIKLKYVPTSISRSTLDTKITLVNKAVDVYCTSNDVNKGNVIYIKGGDNYLPESAASQLIYQLRVWNGLS
jgi:hypothetical protein